MKKIKFFAVALAALAMFSCSKEDVTDVPSVAGAPAEIKIKLLGDGKDTRAVGTPTDAADAVINNLAVLLFREDGTLDAKKYFNTTDNITITGTTSAKHVFVVANTGDIITAGALGSVSTIKQLKDAITKLTSEGSGAGDATQTNGNVYMSGEGEVTEFSSEGDKQTASVAVTMHFVGAKVEVKVNLDNAKGTYDTDYVIKSAFMLNAAGASKFFAEERRTTLIPDQTQFVGNADMPYFLTGKLQGTETWTNIAKTIGEATSLQTTFTTKADAEAGAHFYVFENDNGTVRPDDPATTILVVEALWKKSPNGTGGFGEKTVYFPVKFTAGDATGTEPITRGNAYKVTVNLKGDFSQGGNGGGGTTDPGDDIKSADVSITVTPADWTTKDISKDFN